MALTRIFTRQPLTIDSTVELEKKPSAHLKVLHMQQGETLQVFNGDGFNYTATIVQTGKSVSLHIVDKTQNTHESRYALPCTRHLTQRTYGLHTAKMSRTGSQCHCALNDAKIQRQAQR